MPACWPHWMVQTFIGNVSPPASRAQPRAAAPRYSFTLRLTSSVSTPSSPRSRRRGRHWVVCVVLFPVHVAAVGWIRHTQAEQSSLPWRRCRGPSHSAAGTFTELAGPQLPGQLQWGIGNDPRGRRAASPRGPAGIRMPAESHSPFSNSTKAERRRSEDHRPIRLSSPLIRHIIELAMAAWAHGILDQDPSASVPTTN